MNRNCAFGDRIKKSSFKKICMIVLLIAVNLFSLTAEESVTTIKITNARQTSYKKSEDSGDDIIVLDGAVELSVQKNSTTSDILADHITYNRKTKMLYAEGNVQIKTTDSGSGGETTNANSLLMNTSTMEGIFDSGKVVQTQTNALNLPSGSTLIVFSDLFGKGSENTITFKNSSLTFCDDEEPHWHIDSTRTWLLSGGEFAFFNALLYVGQIPVLYLPAFYYPKDELVFNPVFNYRKREGYSVQTTTYLYGRKPLSSSTTSSTSTSDSSSSTTSTADTLKGLYNFIRPSTLKEQKLEGLVLHNLDEDYTGNTSQYFKIMADWYSNLGAMVGFDSSFQPSQKYLTKFALRADAGFSNTIFKWDDGSYYPFSATGVTYKDSSSFMGIDMPFRYSGNLELTLSKPFSLTLSLPVYSDPFYNYDFKTYRSETMDWISYLMDNLGTSSDSSDDITITEVSSFTWQLTSSASPTIPDLFKPYVSSLSFKLNSSVNISSISATTSEMTYEDSDDFETEWTSYTPSRRFYYPSLVTPASTSLSISGTIFSWPLENKKSTKTTNNFPITLNKPEELKTPKEVEKEAKAAEEEARKKAIEEGDLEEETEQEEKKEEEENDIFEYYLPDLAYTPSATSVTEGFTYKLGYSASAELVTQMAYSSANLGKSDDFKWSNVRSSMYTLKTPVSLNSTLNYGGNFFSAVNTIKYSPVYQKHPYISDDSVIGYTLPDANKLILADYNAEAQDILQTNNFSLKPFTYTDIFTDSSISWDSTIKLLRRKFIGDLEHPEWQSLVADWDDEDSITVNTLTAVISAKEYYKKFGQALTLTTVMPPLLKQYNASLAFTFPYTTLTFSSGFQETTHDDVDNEDKWKKNPFSEVLSVSFPLLENTLTFSQSYSYNIQDDHQDSFKLAASWYGFSIDYKMSYTTGYDFNEGWVARTDSEYLPYSLTFSYVSPSKTFYKWFNRISFAPALNTSISADLIRPTNSYLLFTPSLNFKLTDFLTLTFSSTSRNSVLYWYFHNEEDDLYSDWGGFPGNIVKDLIDSFRFDSQSTREGSGFKLKSLNMAITHELHDWKFNMTLKIEPRQIIENGKKMYDFNPYLTIGVVWNPMDSMKTQITDNYGEWKLE